MSDKYNYGFKLILMAKDVNNAKGILENSIFFNSMNDVLIGCENMEGDYTNIVKHIEKLNKKTFK